MVGAINAPSSGNTYAAFQANAKSDTPSSVVRPVSSLISLMSLLFYSNLLITSVLQLWEQQLVSLLAP